MQHNQFCPLCNNHLEDAQHLTNCPFNKEVIRLIWSWFNLAASTGPITESLDTASWLNSNAARASSPQARIYRNFIILLVQYLKRMQQAHLRLSSVAKEEIDMYEMFSCRGGGLLCQVGTSVLPTAHGFKACSRFPGGCRLAQEVVSGSLVDSFFSSGCRELQERSVLCILCSPQ
jgi:hypothetical protein